MGDARTLGKPPNEWHSDMTLFILFSSSYSGIGAGRLTSLCIRWTTSKPYVKTAVVDWNVLYHEPVDQNSSFSFVSKKCLRNYTTDKHRCLWSFFILYFEISFIHLLHISFLFIYFLNREMANPLNVRFCFTFLYPLYMRRSSSFFYLFFSCRLSASQVEG